MKELLTIGELARRSGLSVKLIRHWSDIGVVPPSERTHARYRLYDADAVARLDLARTLRDLGLGMAQIRDIVERDRSLTEVAEVHLEALDAQIRSLRLQRAVLRWAINRNSTAKELATVNKLARLSADERRAIMHDFVAEALADLDVPTYRAGLLAAAPELPDDPSPEQVEAWIELVELVRDADFRATIRRYGEYSAQHAPGHHDEETIQLLRHTSDVINGLVRDAMAAGIPPDSPAADPCVSRVVAAWIPSQAGTVDPPTGDDEAARRLLLEQWEIAADRRAERYWQLTAVVNGWPVPAGMDATGDWLLTALRANPSPGARAAQLAEVPDDEDPAAVLRGCVRVLAEVGELVAAVTPARFGDPTPCADWDVRALLDHLVWENLLWTSLAVGAPRADFDADHLGDDHVGAFRAAAAEALRAFDEDGMLTRQYGPAPGWRLVQQLTIEMLVHGWDLARSTGRSTDLAPEVVALVRPAVEAIYGALPRTAGGSFAPAQPVPEGATAADALAAYLGREV